MEKTCNAVRSVREAWAASLSQNGILPLTEFWARHRAGRKAWSLQWGQLNCCCCACKGTILPAVEAPVPVLNLTLAGVQRGPAGHLGWPDGLTGVTASSMFSMTYKEEDPTAWCKLSDHHVQSSQDTILQARTVLSAGPRGPGLRCRLETSQGPRVSRASPQKPLPRRGLNPPTVHSPCGA